MVTGTAGGEMLPAEYRQVLENSLKDNLGFTPDELFRLTPEELVRKLDELNLVPAHLDQLGDFFAAWAETEQDQEVVQILRQRALLLYDLAASRSGIYDPRRKEKEEQILERMASSR